MNQRMKLFIPGVFFILMLGLLLFGLGRNPNQVPSALVDRPLPQFNLPDLNQDMGSMSSSDLQGSISIINFWATWCPPCQIYRRELQG
jgi:cytochrome c biogenesis protein CcmG/thiol:disulfide interchange protein DsbE